MSTAQVLEFPTTFDCGRELREFVSTTELVDPREIAQAFVAQVPDDVVRDALTDALSDRVRTVQHEIRHRVQTGRPSHSPKWDQVARDKQSGALDSYIVSLGLPAAKRLLDCTYEDLEHVADAYLRLAAANERQGEIYGRLRAALKRHKAKVVGDLPEATVLEVLNA